MDRDELRYYLALYLSEGIGAKRVIALREYFGSSERAYRASNQELERIEGFGKGTAASLASSKEEAFELAARELDPLGQRQIVTYFDEEYPPELKQTFSPPALLFAAGNTEILTRERKVAIIGTRKITDYGKRCTKEFAESLVKASAVIVSGFASGVDTHAHVAAYEANGETIAVLGSGLDVIYPPTNKQFSRDLLESGRGLILSELPLKAKPDARNFPWRNRIVSGLSKGIVVTESDEQGGSMITASIALDQNRDVFAVPGDITRPSSRGPNKLIQESRAKLVRSGDEVAIELGWLASKEAKRPSVPAIQRTALNLFENKIVDILEAAGGPIHIDTLAERSQLEVQDLLVQLLGLEFKNIVRQMAGKQFCLVGA